MSTITVEDVLSHFGVKGMKWGRRRSRAELEGARSDDSRKLEGTRAKAKDTKIASLSNKELQEAITRMSLERQFKASVDQSSPGRKFVKNLLGDPQAQQLAVDQFFEKKVSGDDAAAVKTAMKQKTVVESVVRSTRGKQKNK